MLKEGKWLQCEKVIVWNWLSELSRLIQDEMRNKMIYVESVGLCRKIVSREQYREWCVWEGNRYACGCERVKEYKCIYIDEVRVCVRVWWQNIHINICMSWLYVMDYYKCMLRERGDRKINMYIQDSKGVCEDRVNVCIYIYMYVGMYVCKGIELKKGDSW